MKPYIINIAGKAQHGKDTFAKYLMDELYEQYGKTVLRLAFGDAVKEKAKEYGWNGEKDENGRSFIQYVGQKEREIDAYVWVKKVYKKFRNDYNYIILSDTRYPNEIGFFHSHGYRGITVNIIRLNPDGTEWDNGMADTQKQHKSVTALRNYRFNYHFKGEKREGLKSDAKFLAWELEG